jgi:hypothetical protein
LSIPPHPSDYYCARALGYNAHGHLAQYKYGYQPFYPNHTFIYKFLSKKVPAQFAKTPCQILHDVHFSKGVCSFVECLLELAMQQQAANFVSVDSTFINKELQSIVVQFE